MRGVQQGKTGCSEACSALGASAGGWKRSVGGPLVQELGDPVQERASVPALL